MVYAGQKKRLCCAFDPLLCVCAQGYDVVDVGNPSDSSCSAAHMQTTEDSLIPGVWSDASCALFLQGRLRHGAMTGCCCGV
jgi:hypothetical protein